MALRFSPLSTQGRGTGTYHSMKRAPTSIPSARHSADIASNISHLALLFHKTCFKNSSTQHSKVSMASPVSLTTYLYVDHLKLSTTETCPNSWKEQSRRAWYSTKTKCTSSVIKSASLDTPGRQKESNLTTRKYQQS